MCGIVGYIGNKRASKVLLDGLKRLEYRGYDSAGMALIEDSQVIVIKKAGKVADLEALIDHNSYDATVGIAHTRWATHGAPTDLNAHPHPDNSGNIYVVHNGIIENYQTLKKKLQAMGYTFSSETDTEVLAVLIGAFYDKLKDLELAVMQALNEVVGTFGVVVVSNYEPDKIIAGRRGSPMVLGIGEKEFIFASDPAAIIEYTRQVIYLRDDELFVAKKDRYIAKNLLNEQVESVVQHIDFDLEQIEKGGYEHFMLKEIIEQPETFQQAYRGRLLAESGNVRLGGLLPVMEDLRKAKRIIFTACGTSWHAGMLGEYLIERLAHIPVEVEYASEFRYRNPVLYEDDIVIAISQSGETADTLGAIAEAKQKGAKVLGIVNVVGSAIARETIAGIYIHAGPEIGVASTKAFTSQVAVLILLALLLGRMKNISEAEGIEIAKHLTQIPEQMKEILGKAETVREIAKIYKDARNFLYLGRGFNFPVALEGALKLKEISYIHAEGYPAAEMKHGPIALIDENMPVVFIATEDEIYHKIISNIEEVKARKGKIIVIATEGDENIKKYADHIIYIPKTLSFLTPVLAIIPLQLLAYYIAVEKGLNPDKPRNLAKCVTVE